MGNTNRRSSGRERPRRPEPIPPLSWEARKRRPPVSIDQYMQGLIPQPLMHRPPIGGRK